MSTACTCSVPSNTVHVCSETPKIHWLSDAELKAAVERHLDSHPAEKADTERLVAEAADRDRVQRTLTDRIETFDEAELLRALRHLAHQPVAMDAVNDALDAIERGDA